MLGEAGRPTSDRPAAQESAVGVREPMREVHGHSRRRRRQIVLILLPMVLGGVGAFLFSSSRPEVYEATADVALERGVKDLVFDYGATQPKSVGVEVRFVQSAPVVAAVQEQLGVAPPVSVLALGSGDAFEIRASASDGPRAASVANAYATEYIRLRKDEAIAELEATKQEVGRKLEELQRELDGVAPDAVARRSTLESERGVFKQQLDQLQVASALRTGGVRLLREATPPSSPVEPNPKRDAAVGLSLGLLTGLGLVLLTDWMLKDVPQ